MSKTKWVLLALLVMTNLTCGEAPFVAAPGSTLTVIANPPFIVANGGVSVISALVIEPDRHPRSQRDGGAVLHDPRKHRGAGPDEGRRGPRQPGGGHPLGDRDRDRGHRGPDGDGGHRNRQREPRPDPRDRGPGEHHADPRFPYITANVFDENGNPIANIPVIFSVGADPRRRRSTAAASPVFTDTNGQAFDILRHSASRSDPEGT